MYRHCGDRLSIDKEAMVMVEGCTANQTVFVTLLHTAVEMAISKIHKLLRAGRVPTP